MNTAFRSILVLSLLAGVSGALGAALLLPGFTADADTVAATIGFLAVSGLGAMTLIGRGRTAPRALPLANITPIRVNPPVRLASKARDRDTRLAA
jgi:hypothetical protein